LHPLLDVRPWPRALLRYPLLVLTACLLGGLCAFTYSYAPLHRAKDWRISYLESRIEIRNAQVREFEGELAQARNSLESQPSADELKELRAQLSEATKLAEAGKRDTRELDRKLTSMTKSRDSYKRRHAASSADLKAKKAATEVAKSSPPPRNTPEPEAAPPLLTAPAGTETESEASVPASPAPVPEDGNDANDRTGD
jgi:hypothetical protein